MFARALETGIFKGDLARAASRIWGEIGARNLVRQLHVPKPTRVIVVGGATLGGSGKTPVAIAWARRESESGARVTLIGHGYRAHPKRAQLVSPDSDVHDVGDEALVCARALRGVAEVVVAKSRQSAVDFAIARGAEVLVLDGVAQISPRQADVAVLVVDDDAIRSNACPPMGDLRAPLAALESHCDVVVAIALEHEVSVGIRTIGGRVVCAGARASSGVVIPLETLTKMRLGLALSIARPVRVLRQLERHGIRPAVVSFVGDHRGDQIRRVIRQQSRREPGLDAWLISEKCASFAKPTSSDTVPIYVVAHGIELVGALS